MTCRHSAGDPNCGSSPEGARRVAEYSMQSERASTKKQVEQLQVENSILRAQIAAASPDAARFEIDEIEAVGPHVVVKVLFPNCAQCAYEGKKVLVYLGVTLKDVIKWRRLVPHFRAETKPRAASEAPSPAARFPASAEGWTDALAWAASKGRKGAQSGGIYVEGTR